MFVFGNKCLEKHAFEVGGGLPSYRLKIIAKIRHEMADSIRWILFCLLLTFFVCLIYENNLLGGANKMTDSYCTPSEAGKNFTRRREDAVLSWCFEDRKLVGQCRFLMYKRGDRCKGDQLITASVLKRKILKKFLLLLQLIQTCNEVHETVV